MLEDIDDINFAILNESDPLIVLELKKRKSRLYYFLLSKSFVGLKINKFYLSYFYDWRGRFYSYSALDPLYNKHLRPFYKLESLLNEASILSSIFYKKINLETNNLFSRDPIKNYFISIVYLEIGKMHVKRLISPAKSTLTLKEVMGLGINNKHEPFTNVESELYRMSMLDELSHLENHDRPRNFTVFKDATASSFQHWAVLLGLKSSYDCMLNFNGSS